MSDPAAAAGAPSDAPAAPLPGGLEPGSLEPGTLEPGFGAPAALTTGAPPAAAPRPRRRAGPPAVLGVVRDNLEAVGFALVLALLLRHVVLEVFQIPTSSMEPTLFGKDSDTRGRGTPGDRILVSKDAYLFHEPERWDIVVFHYPLFWPKAFVKRLAFLPGEAGRIERGDLWVGDGRVEGTPVFHPARKPRNVREQLWVPFYPPRGADLAPDVLWRAVPDGPAGLDVRAHGTFGFRGDAGGPADAPEFARRRYEYPIRDVDRAGFRQPGPDVGGSFLCPDVRLRARVVPKGPCEVELAWEPGDGRRHVLVLATAGRGPSRLSTRAATRELAARLVPGRATEVELESVDGDVHAFVDGGEVAVLADELPLEAAVEAEALAVGGPPQRLTLGARGAAVDLEDVRADHDLYYTNYRADGTHWPRQGEFLRLGPEDHFMLGDNTRWSSDSRKWQASRVRLKDGRTVLYDPNPGEGVGPQPKDVVVDGALLREVLDVEGVRRRWRRDEEVAYDPDDATTHPSVRLPFVRRDRVIGRAWAGLVFWPLREVLPRLRFVR